jgi:hypothetical protein
LTAGMRRAGFFATLAAGVALLGASLHGLTSMDATLKIAAATPAPRQASPQFVSDPYHDCHRGGGDGHHRGPRV